MKTSSTAVLLAGALALAAVTFSVADDSAAKTPAPPPALKSVSCPPDCGFMCRSHDEKELIEIVKAHAKNAHGRILTDEQIRSFMQTEAPVAVAKKG